ncbi:hypothetical protein MKX07_003345 [Trichoderma sp. CBMAI-0711]|nr:hypothetical protein MKX07_003345 [Trichoderma sp. CBMAI-0711]
MRGQRTDLVLDEPTSEGFPQPFVLAPQPTHEHDVAIAARGLEIQRPVRHAVGRSAGALGSHGGAGGRLFARQAVRVAHGVERRGDKEAGDGMSGHSGLRKDGNVRGSESAQEIPELPAPSNKGDGKNQWSSSAQQ